MNRIESRIKRIEEIATSARGKRFAYCWIEPNEDETVALERWRQENPGREDDAMVFIVRWAGHAT